MYSIGQFSSVVAIHRFQGEIAVPSGIFYRGTMKAEEWAGGHPTEGKFLWRDKNGNGEPDKDEYAANGSGDGEAFCLYVDKKGDLWDAIYDPSLPDEIKWRVRRLPLQGLDAHGNPIYDWSKAVLYANPAQMYEIGRLEYHPETDTMYLMGFNKEFPRKNDIGEQDPSPWGSAGRALYRYDNWSQPTRQLHSGYPISVPYYVRTVLGGGSGYAGEVKPDQRTADFEGSLLPADFVVPADAGQNTPGESFLFVIYGVNGPSTCDKNSRNEIRVFDVANGQFVGRMVAKDPVDIGSLGWMDTRRALKGIRRNNGEYILTTEEGARGKYVLYRWKPTPTARAQK